MRLLTPNFKDTEFDVHEPWPNDAQSIENRQRLANIAQWLRSGLGLPVFINSGWRSPERNARVGGVPNSQHLDAEAIDVTIWGASRHQIAAFILSRYNTCPEAIGQAIVYSDTSHVHISIPGKRGKRNEFLYAYRSSGVRKYRPLTEAFRAGVVSKFPIGAAILLLVCGALILGKGA